MITLRTARLQSRRRRLQHPFLGDSYTCCLGSITPHSPFTQQHSQQRRSYLFLPVSWSELRERVERWLERTESRIIEVSLLKRRGTQTKWKQLMEQKEQYTKNKARDDSSLPLPSSQFPASPFKVANVYQRWKMIRKKQYELWKYRRKEQYQGWKHRRHQQYQSWTNKRKSLWIKRRQVILEEYSKAEWFDELGRPLTARDSTGRFVNPWQSQSTNGIHSVDTLLRWKWQRFVRESVKFVVNLTRHPTLTDETSKYKTTSPLLSQEVPPVPIPSDSDLHCSWIGHSTCMFQVKNEFTILTDPIFSTRASPFKNFIGVLREVPPAFTIQELVGNLKQGNNQDEYHFESFDLCCITHDHYDHMDTESVKALKDHVQLWVVPVGIKEWLVESCSIDPCKIVELLWWQQLRVCKTEGRVNVLVNDDSSDSTHNMNGIFNENKNDHDVLAITCCPSSHWAGRTMFDRNLRLWCSFAFRTSSFNVFYCGDTGYPENFPLFRQIGDALGPFDLSCIPIGAYDPRDMNKDSHCNPQEAVQIHKDLHSKQSVGIHWGSFQLTEEFMDAPPRDLEDAIRREQLKDEPCGESPISHADKRSSHQDINFGIMGHGETLVLKSRTVTLEPQNNDVGRSSF